MDLARKFGINKFFPWKIWALFLRNAIYFLKEANAAVTFA